MPIYEYQCQSCGKHLEIMQRYTDMPLANCPDCGGPVRKLISSTSFVLKGTGWYKTDYASSGSGEGGRGRKGNGAKPGAKAESTETKTESKTETKSEPAAQS